MALQEKPDYRTLDRAYLSATALQDRGRRYSDKPGSPMRAAVTFLSICLGLIPATTHAATIHDAAKKGDVAAISAALDTGANINESDGTATPLYYAVMVAQLAAAKLLIERGADVNTVSTLGDTPLGPAVGRRNIEFIRLLLEHGANPNSAMGGSQNILHFAVTQGCLDCVKSSGRSGRRC
jgi:cytochrome c